MNDIETGIISVVEYMAILNVSFSESSSVHHILETSPAVSLEAASIIHLQYWF